MAKAREHELFTELKAARLKRADALEEEEEAKQVLAGKKTVRRKYEMLIETILDEITTGKRRDSLIEYGESRAAASADDDQAEPESETADERQRGPTEKAAPMKAVQSLTDAVRCAFNGLAWKVKDRLMEGATDEEIGHALPSLPSFSWVPGSAGGVAWTVSGGNEAALWFDGDAKYYPDREKATLNFEKLIGAVRLACKIPTPKREPISESELNRERDDCWEKSYQAGALMCAIWPDDEDPEWNRSRKFGSISDREVQQVLCALWPDRHVFTADADNPGWTTFGGEHPVFWVGDQTGAGPKPLGLDGVKLYDAVRHSLRIPAPGGVPRLPGAGADRPQPIPAAKSNRRKPKAVAVD